MLKLLIFKNDGTKKSTPVDFKENYLNKILKFERNLFRCGWIQLLTDLNAEIESLTDQINYYKKEMFIYKKLYKNLKSKEIYNNIVYLTKYGRKYHLNKGCHGAFNEVSIKYAKVVCDGVCYHCKSRF